MNCDIFDAQAVADRLQVPPERLLALPAVPSALLVWYDENARELPWRSLPTAYRVWVSEIMLQQTRVEAVLPYFERFLTALPDVAALSAVEEGQLMKLWQGLGYYSRARNLQRAAQVVMERFGGELPREPRVLLELPGIGPYTAGAIASIAYGLPVPAVDGNVLRVLARLTSGAADVAQPAVRRAVESLVASILPADRPGDFNQALMDLGATVCLPNGAPRCTLCPLNMLCHGFGLGTAATLPVKAPKAPRRLEQRTVYLLARQGKLLLRRRPARGLLAGLWELPAVEGWQSEQQALEQLAQWGLVPGGKLEPLPQAKHIFTHVEWHMAGFQAELMTEDAPQGWRWVDRETLGGLAVPSAFSAYLPIKR